MTIAVVIYFTGVTLFFLWVFWMSLKPEYEDLQPDWSAVAGVALMWPLVFAYFVGLEIVDMFRGQS
ncbi:hypothetical protein MF265_06530 [Serratia marcescens]|uniref:hypothetical protein n=1 Tax=Serratia marcescens TaxID=615 RepID=UPI001EEFDE62|nr:hypothetical protein [Serratia marcescens]ULH12415.1 hypothetical protein MF265_06530 [Serratia marcescens]